MCGVAAVTISRRRVLRVLVLVLSVVVAGCATGPSSGAGDGNIGRPSHYAESGI
jgi:predicted small secreted protein